MGAIGATNSTNEKLDFLTEFLRQSITIGRAGEALRVLEDDLAVIEGTTFASPQEMALYKLRKRLMKIEEDIGTEFATYTEAWGITIDDAFASLQADP
jgi:hypothetical protein